MSKPDKQRKSSISATKGVRARLYKLSGRKSADRSRYVAERLSSLSKTPFGLAYRDAVTSGTWQDILSMKTPKAEEYNDARTFAVDYLLSEILSKASPSMTGAQPEVLREIAFTKLYDSERQCQETNTRLCIEYSRLGSAEFDPVLKLARRKIERCLGAFSWDECSRYFQHGRHASTRLSRRKGDLYYKFRGTPDTTASCETLSKIAISLIKPWAGPVNHWSEIPVNRKIGNRITTVPKTAKTDRTIAIEPCMNMYIQKGIGTVIRQRLRKVGVDLNNQGVNQVLSKLGSKDGSLATIDLSSASDTIATKVVELLLPPDWFEAMNMVRCHFGVFADGTVIRYQKFSTMGNGFTFELESLIFWALCSAVNAVLGSRDTRIGVYGDDLIVSSDSYELLTYTLTRFGFTLNEKKSYATGPFRESCGKHWFEGRDVSPFYIREGIEDVTRELLVVNNLRRWANRVYDGFIPPDVWAVYVELRDSLIQDSWVRDLKIPDGQGDLGVVSSFIEALPQRDFRDKHGKRGWEGWQFSSLSLKPTPRRLIHASRVSGSSLMPKGLSILERSKIDVVSNETIFSIPEESGGEVYSDEIPIVPDRLRLAISNRFVSMWEDVGYPLA